MIRFLRHYAVPAALTFVALLGMWSAWTILGLRIVYADFQVGLTLAVLAGAAAAYMLVLAAFLLLRRRAFLTINPFAILAAYLSIPVALFPAAVCIAFIIIRTSVNSLTF